MFDLGTAKISAKYKDQQVSVGLMASAWTPSLSVKIWDINIVLSAHVGSVGANAVVGPNGFKLEGAAVYGFGLSVTW